jgi:cell division protein ZapA (FtsZ GTPase activity inhibitor)
MVQDNSSEAYNILGYQIKLTSDESDREAAIKAVELIKKEISLIKSGQKISADQQILLAALKIAADRIKLQEFVSQQLDKFDKLCSNDNPPFSF